MLSKLLCALRQLSGQRRYQHVALKIDGGRGGYIDTPENVAAMLADDESPDEYVIRDVWMRPEQHSELKEFEGF